MFQGLIDAGERAETTLVRYRIQYWTHISPTFGRMQMQKTRPEHISRWLAEKRREGLDVASIYSILSLLCNRAVERGLIVESPLKRVPKAERPKRRRKTEPRCPTDAECSALIEAASSLRDRALYATYAYAGPRQSEPLGLLWRELDLVNGVMHVEKQLSRSLPARRVPPKSANSVREVELLPELVALLKQHKVEAFKKGHAGPDDYVFSTADGKPLHHRNVFRDLCKAADRAGLNREGLPKLGTHDLRHASISRWIAAGIDPATVARMAGDDVKTILTTYVHEFDKAKRNDEIRERLAAGTSITLGGAS